MDSNNSTTYQRIKFTFDEQKYITGLLKKEELDIKVFNNEEFNSYLSIKINNQYKKKNLKGSLEPLW